jgi:hemerythrin-like domain-containing protein
MLKENHRITLELFDLYFGTPADSREAVVQQILDRFTSHLEMEETVLFQEIRKLAPHAQTLLEDAEVEHEEVKNMIRELQEAESDDDQSWDELFEDMMETARLHFATVEQDLLPLIHDSPGS